MDLMASPCFGGILIVIPASWSNFSFFSSLRALSSSSNKMSASSSNTQHGSCHLKLMNMALAFVNTELREWCSRCGYANQLQRLYDRFEMMFTPMLTVPPVGICMQFSLLALSIWCSTLLTSCISWRWTVVQQCES